MPQSSISSTRTHSSSSSSFKITPLSSTKTIEKICLTDDLYDFTDEDKGLSIGCQIYIFK